ncbi:hypothetical protein STANM309S_00454 [Streptomyces tanashiensis]
MNCSALKPNFSAISTILSRPTSSPSFANTELQEMSRARFRLALAQPLAWFFISRLERGIFQPSGVWVAALMSVTLPFSSAAAAVTTLKTEPGG